MLNTGFLTLGEVSKRFGCFTWQVARIFERGLLPEPLRLGNYRVVAERDLPIIRRALAECGYISEAESDGQPQEADVIARGEA